MWLNCVHVCITVVTDGPRNVHGIMHQNSKEKSAYYLISGDNIRPNISLVM